MHAVAVQARQPNWQSLNKAAWGREGNIKGHPDIFKAANIHAVLPAWDDALVLTDKTCNTQGTDALTLFVLSVLGSLFGS